MPVKSPTRSPVQRVIRTPLTGSTKRYPSGLIHLWNARNPTSRLVGPSPVYSAASQQPDADGNLVDWPVNHPGKGVQVYPAYSNLFISTPQWVKTFEFDVINTQTIDGVFQTAGTGDANTIIVDWGDGTVNTYVGTTDQGYSKSYVDAIGTRHVTVYASSHLILKKFTMTTTGANIGGPLVMNEGMTYFVCYGFNTFSGTLNLPTKMTYFGCAGYNTLSGTLNLPAGMTSFVCSGFNTFSGTLNLPAGMKYFVCTGSNTLSGYIPSAKAINQARFYLAGSNTMSATDVDNILIDYAAAGGTWESPKEITIQGNAANRTAASDAAYANLATKLLILSVD